MLSRSTPEGARDFLVPSRREPGSFYALPQSPQLFKQLLMVAGFERYFQIVRCFRDEDQRADRQPDFTQLDIEMSFVEVEDVIDLNERLLAAVFARGRRPASSSCRCARIPYDEAIDRYGTDRPDLRFGLELVDLTDLLAETEFKVFRGVIEGGGDRQGPQRRRRDVPRSVLDGLIGRAQELGAKGLVWAFREGEGWRSPTAKFLSAEELAALNERLGAEEGDLLLVVADQPGGRERGARPAAPRPRRALRADRPGGRGVLLDRRLADVRLERDRAALGPAPPPVHRAGRRASTPRPRRRAGARLRRRLERPGARRRLDPYLRLRASAAGPRRRSGSSPRRRTSASASCSRRCATGRRRTAGSPTASTAWSSGSQHADSIRDVIAFPKTASGADPLTGAPAPVDEVQLRELGLALRAKRPG